jgi:4-amino-4-deoxy-L-arabinose transferase-like glycosyltransferase
VRGGAWFSRFIAAAADRVNGVLYRTKKHRMRPGVIAFRHSALDWQALPEYPIDSIDKLWLMGHAHGRTVGEAVFTESGGRAARPVSVRHSVAEFCDRLRFWWNAVAFPAPRTAPPSPAGWAGTRWLSAAIVLLLAVFVLFANLGYPLFEPDENRNAQLALNIYHTGDWMSLHLEGHHYWDKPPLQPWLIACSYHLFGPTEFATRLPCALTSLLTVIALLFAGSRLAGFRTAAIGALLLVLCAGFSVVARYTTMDASLDCFATVMLLAILLAIEGKTLRQRWLLVAGVAFGLGLLTKGPVIGVLVLPPVLIAGWLSGQGRLLQPRFWVGLLFPALVIATPWFLATSLVHPEFVNYFFWTHHVVRFTDAFNHREASWYYIPALMVMTFPAVFVLPNLIRLVLFSPLPARRDFGRCFGGLILYVIWIVVFFSLSEAKLPTYILPAIPVLCLLMGRSLDLDLMRRETRGVQLSRTARYSAVTVAALFAVLVAGSFFAPPAEARTWIILPLALAASLLLAVIVLQEQRRHAVSLAAAAFSASLFIAVLAAVLIPEISTARSSQVAVLRLASEPEFNKTPIMFYGRPPRGLWIWRNQIDAHHFDDESLTQAVSFLKENPNSIIVAIDGDIAKLEQKLDSILLFEKHVEHRRLFSSHPLDSPRMPNPGGQRVAHEAGGGNECPLLR